VIWNTQCSGESAGGDSNKWGDEAYLHGIHSGSELLGRVQSTSLLRMLLVTMVVMLFIPGEDLGLLQERFRVQLLSEFHREKV
jgi:hypothetical protein